MIRQHSPLLPILSLFCTPHLRRRREEEEAIYFPIDAQRFDARPPPAPLVDQRRPLFDGERQCKGEGGEDEEEDAAFSPLPEEEKQQRSKKPFSSLIGDSPRV